MGRKEEKNREKRKDKEGVTGEGRRIGGGKWCGASEDKGQRNVCVCK